MKSPQKPTKKDRLTPKQKKFLEVFIKKMGHITDTCKEVKIDRGTYYDWMEKELFKRKLDEEMEHFNDSVQRRILKLAMKDDRDMLKFWAKNLMKHRGFVEKSESLVEHTGEQIKIIIEEKKPDAGDKSSTQS